MAAQCTNAGPGKRNCKGANHVAPCAKYVEAVENWLPPTPKRKPRSGKKPEKGAPPVAPEVRAAQAREAGKKGGRPPGSGYAGIPLDAIRILKKGKFRVKQEILNGDPEIAQAATELAGYSLERLAMVVGAKVPSKRAPAAVKAIDRLRNELCEPVVEEKKITGTLDVGKALAEIEERKKA